MFHARLAIVIGSAQALEEFDKHRRGGRGYLHGRHAG
jgi:hypothetical protein